MTPFSLFLFVFSVIASPLPTPIQQDVSSPFSNQPVIKPVTSGTSKHDADACQIGARSIVQDAKNLNQTLTWEIGEVRSAAGETWCKTIMRMDYDPKWQYAVSNVDWSSHITTDDKTQAVVQFSYNFESNNRIVSFCSAFPPQRSKSNRIIIGTIPLDHRRRQK
jgi:hypothetical protein